MELHHISFRSQTTNGLFCSNTVLAHLDIHSVWPSIRFLVLKQNSHVFHCRSGITPCPEDSIIIPKKPCKCKTLRCIIQYYDFFMISIYLVHRYGATQDQQIFVDAVLHKQSYIPYSKRSDSAHVHHSSVCELLYLDVFA